MSEVNRDRPVRIHGLADAIAALAAADALGCPVTLVSAPGAGRHGGGEWFKTVVQTARLEYPNVTATAVLDCADQPGDALAAVRAGVADIALAAPEDVVARVHAIAAQQGARVHAPVTGGLDLRGHRDPAATCRRWLSA